VAPHLARRDPLEVALAGRAEGEGDPLHGGGEEEVRDAEGADAVAQPAPAQLAEERAGDDVAEPALRVGHAHVERFPGQGGGVVHGLGPEQEDADLWAVAVGEEEPPAGRRQVDDLARGGAHVLELLGEGAALAGADERVAADGEDGPRGHATARGAWGPGRPPGAG
jgi:hypothetical protein